MSHPNVEPVAPSEGPEPQVPESQRGLFTDVVAAVITDEVARPIVNGAAQAFVDEIRDVITGPGDLAYAAPDDGGFLDS